MRIQLLCTIILIWFPQTRIAQSSVEDVKKFELSLSQAKEGVISEMNEVGVMYAEGIGVKADQNQAVLWFRRAAEFGDAHGAGNLGFHYFRGKGLNKDKLLAAKWFMICHSLDALRCFPNDYIAPLKLTKQQQKVAWQAAVNWLRARPDLKNNHGDRPWFGKTDSPKRFRSNQ